MKSSILSYQWPFNQKIISPFLLVFWALTIGFLCTVFVACNGSTKENETSTPPSLYPQPQKVKINTNSDSPKVIKNVTPKIASPESLGKPKISNINKGAVTTVNAFPNQYYLSKKPNIITINKSKVKITKLGKGNQDIVLRNTKGDTLPTGVPIPTKGKVVKAIYSKPIKALPPSIKDAAIANLQFLNVEHGLSASLIYSIMEDKKGNIWFGTDGGGITLYNGVSFTHFAEKEGLSNNIVWKIFEDKAGNIWVSTCYGGVSVFNGESFTHFTEKEGLPRNFFWTVAEDKKGNIWLGSGGFGVSVFNGKSFTHYTRKEGLSNGVVKAIMEDKTGNIWLGTDFGVNVFNGESFTNYTETDGLPSNYINVIKEDKNGNVWIGTEGGGVSVFDGKSFTNYSEKDGLSSDYVSSILIDKRENVYIGTNGGGFTVFNGETFTQYTEKEGLSSNNVTSLLEDQSGKIWVGTIGGGVNIFNSESFTHYSDKNDLTKNYVNSMLSDKKGNVWLGSAGGGVSVFNGKNYTNYTTKANLSNDYVSSLFEDKSGNLWIGTNGGGLNIFNGTTFTHYGLSAGLSNSTVWSMKEDRKENIWLSSFIGVSIFNGKGFSYLSKNEGLSNNNVYNLLEDKKGHIWMATDGGGVNFFDGNSLTHYTPKEGLGYDVATTMIEDKLGNVWIGTIGGGLSIFDGKSFTNFTEKEGLTNNIVWSIIEDKKTPSNQVKVYVGTEKGLSLITLKDKKNKSVKEPFFSIQNFGTQDGLKSLNFLRGATIDQKNNAWWGTGSGIVKLNLDTFSFSDKIPQPRLTQLEINDQYIDYHKFKDNGGKNEIQKGIKFNGIQKFSNYPLNLKLPYQNNHLTFHFVAIDWAAPHKINYSHRMVGLNSNWSPASDNPIADYRNLTYGSYTFQVLAIGESGIWSKPFNYTFTILPPWWHTWWAYAIYVLLFLAALRFFSLWRERRLQAEKEILQVKVDERTLALNKKSIELEHSLEDLKSTQSQLIQSEKMASLGELTAGIAHEIQNPLNFVNNFSEVSNELLIEMNEELDKGDIEEAKAISADIKQNLEKINHHGKRADAIVKGMLQHSRKSSGIKEPTDINKLVDENLVLAYHSLRAKDKNFNATLKSDFDATIGNINIIPQDMGRVILNLITNAFYTTNEKQTLRKAQGDNYEPTVTVSTKKLESTIEISVKDNGNGIPPNIVDKIFQPFFTTKPTGEGTGLGLSLSYDIIKAHGGEITVETIENQGTNFKIVIPI